MAQDALFVDGQFQAGNIGLVTGTMGFAGAGSFLTQVGQLTSGRNPRDRNAAAAALTATDEDTASMARRLGLDEGASAETVRKELVDRARTDQTFLEDLVRDVLPSVGVEASEEAEADLRRRGYQAMIDIAEATTFVVGAGGRAMRTTNFGGADSAPAEANQ